jgi:hypothetical protein
MFTAYTQNIDRSTALKLVKQHNQSIGLSESAVGNAIVSNAYINKVSGTHLVYLQQGWQGLPVYNKLLTLAFKDGQLVSRSGSFVPDIEKKLAQQPGTPAVSANDAAITAMSSKRVVANKLVKSGEPVSDRIYFEKLTDTKERISAQLMWVPLAGSDKIVLAWQVNFSPAATADNWLIRIDAITNDVIDETNLTVYCNFDHDEIMPAVHNHSAVNTTTLTKQISPAIVNGASYRVVPYPAESPIHPGGTPDSRSNPWTLAGGNATSLKWHSDGTNDYNYTRGNNVWAYHDRLSNNSPSITRSATSTTTADPFFFEFVPDFTLTPTQATPVENQQFNITNLFYWNNIIHDLTYLYGFDEVSGNFQANNQGRGGLGNDAVRAEAQDGGGSNNANFNSPADGGSGVMQMYLWNGSPQKDGDADNGIIVHEFSHGVSTRLTGGPAQSGCLGNNEQMGEGWSDYFSLMATQNWATAAITDGFNNPRGIGTYASAQAVTGPGIRPRRYTTNMAINEITYANLPAQVAPHGVGFVWCTMLWDMTWEIIQTAGINPNLFDPTASGGNTIALKLVTEGMKLQPCSPGFIDGRDAIRMADQLLYGGQYRCAIMRAFARRGLGFDANQGSSNSKNDGAAGFSAVESKLTMSQNLTSQQEGLSVTYTNRVAAGPCSNIANYLLTDTLPANVTYVSGGAYNTFTRVVSFPVNVPAGQSQDYSFTVQINVGSWFPEINLFEDNVPSPVIGSSWTRSSITNANWIGSNARSHTPANSYYSAHPTILSDQVLSLTNAVSVGPNPPPLSFWHWFSTESNYDGGVLESSVDGGNTWADMGPFITSGNYTGTMATNSNSPIGGRGAWTGNSNGFMKTEVNLSAFANQNLKIRFRSTTDDGTNSEGWFVDDIAFKKIPTVDIRSSLFNVARLRVNMTDTFTLIRQASGCVASFTSQPANVEICPGANATFSTAVNGNNLSYQWQVSTDAGISYSNIPLATNASLTLSNTTFAMNGNRYRVIINAECTVNLSSGSAVLNMYTPVSITTPPAATSACAGSPASFSVAAAGTSLTYQWQVSVAGGPFQDLQNSATFSGVRTSLLNISSTSADLNGNVYRAVITGTPCGSVNSAGASLVVHPLPAVTIVAANYQALTPGINTTISATAIPAGSYSFQWYRGNVLIPGATGGSLPVYIDGLGEYSAIVTNTNGCSARSNLLSIRDSASSDIFIYPNPSTGRFQVRYYHPAGAGAVTRTIVVYDAKGAKVFVQQFASLPGYSRMDVNLTNLQRGVYLVDLRDGKGARIASAKLLLQ